MAEKRKSLTDIAQTVTMVLNVLATYGVSLSACSVPGMSLLCTEKTVINLLVSCFKYMDHEETRKFF
jgi:hypothetical protein